MKTRILNLNIFYILFASLFVTLQLEAQESKIRADERIEEKVIYERNKKRLKMVGYEWLGIPTQTEYVRMERAFNARYRPYDAHTWKGKYQRKRRGKKYYSQGELLDEQNLTVWAWYPHWKNELYRSFNFKLLTHVAYHGYKLNPLTGGYLNIEAIHKFGQSDLVKLAHEDSCKVLLSLYNHGEDNNVAFFESPARVKENLKDSLVEVLTRTGADGIEISFDRIPARFKDDFNDFVSDLSFHLREANNNWMVALSVPVYDKENIYDVKALHPFVDLFIINSFDFHVKPSGLHRQALSPLFNPRAAYTGTVFTHTNRISIRELFRSLTQGKVMQSTTILASAKEEVELRDSLAYFLKGVNSSYAFNGYELSMILDTMFFAWKQDPTVKLWENDNIARVLSRYNCETSWKYSVAADRKEQFFLFEPNADLLEIGESAIFKHISNNRSTNIYQDSLDLNAFDLRKVIDHYVQEIGEKHRSSIILGLPYHGVAWKVKGRNRGFAGYRAYSEILEQLDTSASVYVNYDKNRHSLQALIGDTMLIYFDNSTSLEKKFDFSVEQQLGGVALWGVGGDYQHTTLWETIEKVFVNRRLYDEETGLYERIQVVSSNKISFTVSHLLRRYANIIFATIFLITILLSISFSVSLLDWKVRDIMFDSGVFRIFYIVLFSVVFLVVGAYFNWFSNDLLAFLIGIVFGLGVTYLASEILAKNRKYLP